MKPTDPSLERLATARTLLLQPYGLDEAILQRTLATVFEHRTDFADLYFQYTRSESYSLEEGIVKSGSFGIDQGVGVRAVVGDKTAFSYSDDISEQALLQAARTVRSIARSGSGGRVHVAAQLAPRPHHPLYGTGDPVASLSAAEKVALLERLERMARARDPRVRQGMASLAAEYDVVVAARGVTVIDDGTLVGRRGSLAIDDEGNPTSRTVLIEDGVLRGYMQDSLNARLMKTSLTGNARRESFASLPMPRMTNTCMLSGDADPDEIIRSVKKGVYATNFGGGQVDITNGKFVFSMAEAYLIENGQIGAPIKGATLIGNGPDALTRVSMIGNDLRMDAGIGTCGKDGQSVPVGVGQPTLRIEGLTVGGTAG